jgi:3-hydroxyacyl-[acyl-carrier-protein] dehydratase
VHYDINAIKKILPHRYPILLVDRVTDLVMGTSLRGYKNITATEPVFEGHFPDQPIYPGVYIIEGMAQAGGILAFESLAAEGKDMRGKIVYFMSIDKAKFRVPVTPGDRLEYRIEVTRHRGNVWQFRAEAYVDETLVAEAELKAMVADQTKDA